MANRAKEDERNEKTIRSLLKLPANRRCINCNSLGPQYVCTNFWTFICTNCSGIHREFTHRVKSVSMAKFTSQEVSALQEGGNERAKEVYFKEWDEQRHSFPDSSNVDRLRDFIKHVYVDRRYTGERSIDRPSRPKEVPYDNRKPESYRGGSRSPSYEETYDRRYGERPGSGGRSDDRNFRSNYEERRSPDQNDYRRSPGQFDVADERRRVPDGVPRPEGRPVIHNKEPEISSPPLVRPVREILGEDAPPLRVGEPPRVNGTKVADPSAQAQRTTSSNSLASSDSNLVELKRVNSGSLIDFDATPEPPVAVAPPSAQPSMQPSKFPVNDGNWASFDSLPQQAAQQPAANLNTVESALAELSVTPSGSSPSTFSTHVDLFALTSDVGNGPVYQQNQPSFFQATPTQTSTMHSSALPFNPQSVAAPTSQPWTSSFAPNNQLPLSNPSGQPSQFVANSSTEANAEPSPNAPSESKPIGRKELPADLFTASYSASLHHYPSWHTGPHVPMGYGPQYSMSMAVPYMQPSRSMNPFASSGDQTLVHSNSFPVISPLQGSLNTVPAPSPLLRTSSLGSLPPPQWVAPQQHSYPSVTASGFPVQQAPSNIPQLQPEYQPLGGFGSEGAAFGAFGTSQHVAVRFTQPGTPNFSSSGGNPFG